MWEIYLRKHYKLNSTSHQVDAYLIEMLNKNTKMLYELVVLMLSFDRESWIELCGRSLRVDPLSYNMCDTKAVLCTITKEGNVSFNNTRNAFYLRLCGVRHMVKDHSDSERGNLLLHRLLFPISSKGSFICIIPDRITHTMAFVTPVVEHWLEREIAQWVHHERSIRRPIAP